MICFPSAKINLGLQVIGKRADGFHEISSILYPISFLHDCLEIEILDAGENHFEMIGDSSIPENQNLVLKVIEWAQKRFGFPQLKVKLIKQIPLMSGLGGGSSNAAAVLLMLNSLFEMGWTVSQMEEWISDFGNDCPFFIENQTAIVSGSGSSIAKLDLSLEGYFLKVIFPGFGMSTAEAYAGIKAHKASFDLSNLNVEDVHQWKNYLLNDMEEFVFHQYPELMEIKKMIYRSGALYASMSGSGSALYGIYDSIPEKLKLEKGFQQWDGRL